LLHDRAEADLRPGLAQRPDDVAEIALGLTQIMRLGETLAGQSLVGDLARAALRIWVVDAVTVRRPFQVGPSCRQRGAAQLFAHARVALGIDDDRAHPIRDRARRDPRLRDRLARAGGAHDKRVRAVAVRAEWNRHRPAALIESDRQPPPVEPLLAAATCASTHHRRSHERAQKIQRVASAIGYLREVRAGFDVFAVPAPTTHGGEQCGDRQRQCRAAQERSGERHERQCAGGPAPVQVPAAHRSRRKQPQHDPHGAVDARREEPVQEFIDGRKRIDRVFGNCVRGHQSHSLLGPDASARPAQAGAAGRWWLTTDGEPRGSPSRCCVLACRATSARQALCLPGSLARQDLCVA
jgi:hypothetical protein